MIDRRVITSENPTLAGLQWPVFEARGDRDGPRLTLMAGIHGCEYPAIAAVRTFMRELDTSELAGSILAVPPPARKPGREDEAGIPSIRRESRRTSGARQGQAGKGTRN